MEDAIDLTLDLSNPLPGRVAWLAIPVHNVTLPIISNAEMDCHALFKCPRKSLKEDLGLPLGPFSSIE